MTNGPSDVLPHGTGRADIGSILAWPNIFLDLDGIGNLKSGGALKQMTGYSKDISRLACEQPNQRVASGNAAVSKSRTVVVSISL